MPQDHIAENYHVKRDVRPEGPVETYEAVDASGLDVAIKIVHTQNVDSTAQFESDLEVAKGLVHDNVARVISWGPYDTGYYVIREWVYGSNLAEVRRKAGISPMKAAEYGMQAASALAALHAGGIVHKDIRPENLVLDPNDTIKLIDVGIPRPGAAMAESAAPPYASQFISPEQAQAQTAGPASDIYSLGVVLYYLCTGHVPFDGTTAHEVASGHLKTQPVSARTRNPQIPLALNAVITRAMAKSPARRYSSAEKMREDLEAALAPQPTPVPAVVPKARPVWSWAFVAAALAVIIGLGALIAFTSPVPNLTGLSRAQAQQRLSDADLKLGEVIYRQPVPTGVREGAVIEQSPSPGWRARSGSAIDITIAGLEQIAVPNLVGLSRTDAEARAREAKLTVGNVQQRVNPRIAAGRVIEQTPAAGTQADVNTPVTIVVSQGTGSSQVPNVVGSPQSEAVRSLRDAGFEVRTTRAFSGTVATGEVIRQTPDAGANAASGGTVAIVVSRGGRTAGVPNVLGLSQADATDTLENAGLRVRITFATSSNTTGLVIRQTPDPGVRVGAGSVVTVVVSTGSRTARVSNVVGLTQADAITDLENTGFVVRVAYTTADGASGRVTSQSPEAGITFPLGATVTIVVAQ